MDFFIKVIMAMVFGVKRHWQILIAILLGFLVGLIFYKYHWAQTEQGQFSLALFDFVGKVFIRLITMIVIPLVVSSLIVGVSSLKDVHQLGRMGGKVFSFFLLFMVISTIIGGTLAYVIPSGENMRPVIEHINEERAQSSHYEETMSELKTLIVQPKDFKVILLEMIPENPIQALSTGNMVPVIIFTILLGFALAFIGPAGKPMISFFESLFTATMKLTDWCMTLAVPGVFALAFVAVASSGTEMLLKLLPYALLVISGLLLQIVVVFPTLLYLFARVDALNLYRAISEAILVAFGTASSSATLPITIANCELRAGISNRIASFVIPTGASINKTGTTMFEVIAVLFLAQAYNIPIDPVTVSMIAVLAIIASVAAAGVPSAGLITMSVIITSMGYNMTLLASGIALLWSIDRILDMCRTVTNVMSSVTVATIVAASEGELKRDLLNDPTTWKETL